MSETKILTFAFMDPPFESERTVTFFRLLDAALEKGAGVRIFAYEGAVALAFSKQSPHGNAVHGHDCEEEAHPLTKDWIAALQEKSRRQGAQL
jgi:tRNA 2-thiouridine synthesizing protein D